MKKIKNLFLVLVLMFAVTMFVACDSPVDNTCTSHVDSNSDGKCDICGVTVSSGGDVDDTSTYDFMGQEFIIMCDLPASVDPRLGTYKKLFKTEKAALISKVEQKYNIKITYKQYPSEASWGGARETYITNAAASNLKIAHIFELPSYSIGTLAVAKAISPLDEYIEKYGNQNIWPEALAYGTAQGKVYGYSDVYPLADEGIYYNIDLLEQYLGKGKGTSPSEMWLNGEWTWDAFEEMCKELNEKMPGDHFVLGGNAYNWSYQMLGANGVHVINTDLKSEVASQAGIDTFVYMNSLYNAVRWDSDCPMNNATSASMVTGKVAFHNGQSYWIFQPNKWLNKNFDIGFVPYPVGTNVLKGKTTYDLDTDLDNYYINDVYGKTQYCISSAYDKSLVKPGYEDSTFHDEIIFQIWSELQYFPAVDPETGYVSVEDYVDEYDLTRLSVYYGSTNSVDAHKTVITKAYPDYFYSLDEAKAQGTETAYSAVFQGLVKAETADDIRSSLESAVAKIHASFKTKYSLPDNYYD